jgi:hypothetical protein
MQETEFAALKAAALRLNLSTKLCEPNTLEKNPAPLKAPFDSQGKKGAAPTPGLRSERFWLGVTESRPFLRQ